MSEENEDLRVVRLDLRNFRCFAECSLELNPKLTILVAENGGGKTALLDGLRIALGVFVTTLGRSGLASGFELADIHRAWNAEQSRLSECLPVEFSATAIISGQQVDWSRRLKTAGFRARNSTTGLRPIQRAAESLGEDPQRPEAQPTKDLPVVAFYSTGRLWDQHRLTATKQWVAANTPVRFSAYLDCLSPLASYKAFVSWFGQTIGQISEPASRALGFQARPENAIIAVREAVKTVLEHTGWPTIDWQFPEEDDEGRVYRNGFVVVEHRGGLRLPLERMSDGIRNMVALVADIAHRCVRLNPHLGEEAARRTPGIVLIDEVDMHLHPSWQQLVVGLLQTAFPKVQFILSTHSPHVLSTVNKESIRLISINEQGQATTKEPAVQTQGDESGNVLARAMHVNPVPNVGAALLLSDYRGLVQNGLDRSERAHAIWQQLIDHFGEGHHLLQEAAVLRDLQEFKREHQARGGGTY